MTAKQLLEAYFRYKIYTGDKFQKICSEIVHGEIKSSSKYIQVLKEDDFYPLKADVEFITNVGDYCYLYKI